MAESLRDKSLSAFLWVLVDKLGGSTANFLVTLVLARLLSPSDFGLIAMVLVFFEISSSFVQSGFGFALVREKTITETDKSTGFIFNLVTALLFYAVLFVAAPAIAVFFRQDALTDIVRVMGLNLIVGAFALVQNAELTQKIDFKTLTKIRLSAVVVSGACAIALAFAGFGVWSLVARIGLMELMSALLLWVLNPWKPLLQFSRGSFRKLFGFGSKILAEAVIDKAFRHLLQVVIGKYYSAATLGFFAQANTFCNMAAGNFLQTIQKVSYPVLAKLQDDPAKLKDGYRRIITMSSWVIVPLMVLMGVLAEPLVVVLVGEKWRESVPFLQLLCIGAAVWHLNSINLDMLLVLGRVDLSLRLEVVKKIITGIAVIIGMQFGIYGLIGAQVAATYVSVFINTRYSERLFGYALGEQLRDVAATVSMSLLTGAGVFFLARYTEITSLFALCAFFGIGFALYGIMHAVASTKEMRFFQSFILPRVIGLIGGRPVSKAPDKA